MKKFLPLMLMSALLSGCTASIVPSNDAKVSRSDTSFTWPLLLNKESKYSFDSTMDKPDLSQMINWNAMMSWFHQWWKNTYKATEEDRLWLTSQDGKTQCSGWITLVNTTEDKRIFLSYNSFVKKWAEFEYTGTFNTDPIPLELTEQQKNKFSNQWWLVTKANSWFLNYLKQENSYEVSDSPSFPKEERVNAMSQIWWSPIKYQRYPFNTLLVTTDLVLHLYHKVFDNSLKYYEESKARPIVQEFSQKMLDRFSKLAQKENNTDLKRQYAFLTAYWMIPSIILIPQDDIISALENPNSNYDGSEDINDTQIKELILERTKSFLAKYKPTYTQEIEESIQLILSGTETEKPDALVYGFVGPFDPSFSIKQDYTQFVPRSHYTESSLLKTYFMGMKWLMREKLYFSQQDLAKASLIMNQNIWEKDLDWINKLQEFVSKIVGQDDDVNIQDIKWFITKKQWKSDLQIQSELTTSGQEELFTLRPQKIISTHYTTNSIMPTETEASAKDKTAGFVFFGEKFTIDSWVFDQITAGTAEEESKIKPTVQSSLAIADILLGTDTTRWMIKERFEKNSSGFVITQSQIDAYPEVKQKTLEQFSGMFTTGTVYAQRIDLLGWNMKNPKNAPYFMEQIWYQNKTLNTFIGSYTELKHDTLLYSKQAYAEMGMWGGDSCDIMVYPPDLEVPRGYVEPNIDVYDSLIDLSTLTSTFFDDESYQEFIDYVKFLRKIAVSESKNEKISDDDFDTLRLSYDKLYSLVLEQKVIGNPTHKAARWSLIADIFTSGKFGPLYVATGRPALMLLMVNDVNGPRVVWWPVYSTYEFYGKPFPMTSGRYTDEDWQQAYDTLEKESSLFSLPFGHLLDTTE